MKHIRHDRLTQLFITIVISLLLASCFGCWSRGAINFSDLRYPVSMSAYLYGPHDEILTRDKELSIVKKFNYEKTYWSNDANDIVENINEEIEKSSGDGMVNFKGSVRHFAPCFGAAWRKIKVEGDIIKFAQMPPETK